MNWKRLRDKPDGVSISFSTHLFLFMTLVFGIAFSLPPEVFNTFSSPLWAFSSDIGFGFYWGLGLIATTIMNTVMLLTRSDMLASITGVAGFSLWLYAAIAYAYIGFWLGFLAAALPNMLFWGWYSIQVARFRNALKE